MIGQDFYRFELVKDGWKVIDQFNLVLAPSAMSFSGRYRSSLTKTSGGTVIDLKRMDNQQITLTATTGGGRDRFDWGKRLPVGHGTDVLKYFRDNIWRYPEHRRYSRMKDELAVRLWDVEMQESYWVHIDDFTYSKSAKAPIGGWYDLQIRMTTIDPPEDLSLAGAFKALCKAWKDTLNCALDSILDVMDDIYETVQSVEQAILAGVGFVTATMDFALAVVGEVNVALNFVRGLEEMAFQIPSDFTDRARRAVGKFTDTLAIIESAVVTGRVLFNGEYAESAEKAWNDMGTTIRGAIDKLQTAADTSKRIEVDFTIPPTTGGTNAWVSRSDGLGGSSVSGSTGNSPLRAGGVTEKDGRPGGRGEPPETRPNHSLEHAVVEGELLSDLAEQYLGDASRAGEIAEYNNLTTSRLEPGQQVKIPIWSDTDPLQDNIVLDRTGDQYGHDFRLDDKNHFVVSATGNLALTTGPDNVRQALQNRILFQTGDLRADRTFGFPAEATVGSPGTAEARKLVAARIKAVIEADPRVAEFADMKVRLGADVIEVTGAVVLAEGIERTMTFWLR